MSLDRYSTGILVVGSGLAGLMSSLRLAEYGHKVILITKDNIDVSNSAIAQGGIASVMDMSNDSFEKHVNDTMTAGDYLNNLDSVRFFVERAPGIINDLIDLGVPFSKNEKGAWDLGKEGGHSERRVIHAGDITGKEVMKSIKDKVIKHKNITIWQRHMAIDLITTHKFFSSEEKKVVGAYVLTEEGNIKTIEAGAVVLATGGCGKVYLYTSNPDIATGDGIAMGFRAGIPACNMEMIQFHPTILYHEKYRSFLISEALRGEGGILRTKDGNTFMEKYHPMKSLAPRDIVARAIDYELKKRGDDFVTLDMTALDHDFIEHRFPNIFDTCLKAGCDMRKEPIPVVPAAHYSSGGLDATVTGKTAIKGVFVFGETAHTGLHGANRLASNSLLEAALMAKYGSEEIHNYLQKEPLVRQNIPEWNEQGVTDSDENVIVKQNWDEIRHFMWNYVGIVRSDKRLERALARISLIKNEINEYYWNFKVTRNLLELRNITLVAEIIIKSSIKRKESRGLHYNIDYPQKMVEAKNTSIFPEEILSSRV